MIKSILAMAMLLAYSLGCAQISISSANYNTVSLNETNILQAIVSNSNGSIPVKATISVKNAAGELIIEAQTNSFNLSTGVNNVSGSTVGFTSFVYGTSGKALYLKNNGLIPAGNYSYCLKITPLNGLEDGDIYCEEFEAATDDFLSLVAPYDKDVIDTKWPVLTWSHSEPFNTLAKNEYFKIVVAEIKTDQSADQAIFANPSVYTMTFVNTHSVPYPQDAKELEDGKKYAWQVQKISNNIIVNKTDVWQFSLRKTDIKEPLKYVLMKSKADAGYYTCYGEILYFRFDEEYSGSTLSYELFDDLQKKLTVEVNREDQKNVPANLKKGTGVNTYELNIDKYKLKEGFYNLVVMNEKNQKFYLKFYVEK